MDNSSNDFDLSTLNLGSKDAMYNHIEMLPAELRRQILDELDLVQLSALVRASPVYHAQYRLDRKYLLERNLHRTIGTAFVDALAVHKIQALKEQNGEKQDKLDVVEFLSWYTTALARDKGNGNQDIMLALNHFMNTLDHYSHRFRGSFKPERYQENWCQPSDGSLCLTDMEGMAAFYIRNVRTVVASFAGWAYDNLLEEEQHWSKGCPYKYEYCTHHKGSPYARPLEDFTMYMTNAEITRVTRATYRLELLATITKPFEQRFTVSDMRMYAAAFFNILEPWEREELFSTYQFAEQIYLDTIDRLRPRLEKELPQFYDRPKPYPQIMGLMASPDASSIHRSIFVQAMSLQGLQVLRDTLSNDDSDIVDTIQYYQAKSSKGYATMDWVTNQTEQVVREFHISDKRDQLQHDQAPLPIVADGPADKWSMGWAISQKRTYSNLFGDTIPDALRRCGYVFWDQSTLVPVGGKKIITKLLAKAPTRE